MFHCVIFLIFECITKVSARDVRLPPDIINGPDTNIIYRERELLTLKCVATGFPEPRYEWTRGGFLIDPNDPYISRPNPSIGTIEIKTEDRNYGGYYQCIATNSYGSAMSNVSVVQKAYLQPFSPGSDPQSVTVQAGDFLVLPCEQLLSIPEASHSWALVQTVNDKDPAIFKTNERVQIDNLGNLHFAYTITSDDQNKQRLYKCLVFNSILDVTIGGSYANVSITPQQVVPLKVPQISFITSSPLIGVVGATVKMRCIFNGNPVSKIKWDRLPQLPPPPRFVVDANMYSTEAAITNLEMGDAGDYICTGVNSMGTNSSTILLRVEAAPTFLTSVNQLSSRNITSGESVTFTCATNAIPEATVKWYRNGAVLSEDNLPPKYRLSSDGLNLTISKLCKTCADSSSDLAVIQCNASNVHGYIFGQGFLNVIERTVITSEQTSVNWVPKMEIVFPCHAVSDDLTPITYKWTFNDQNLKFDNNTKFDQDQNVLYITTENDEDLGKSRVGRYVCFVNNGYSSDSVHHLVSYGAATSSSELWWIAVIIALFILIIIVIATIVFCIMQNKGDSYSVDSKERIGGNDPEKELQNEGFHDYQRFEKAPSKVSLVDTGDKHSVDGNSLDEYGPEDNFDEDGSFLGKYDTTHK